MRNFRFAGTLRKYAESYKLIREAGGTRDDAGDWIAQEPGTILLRGSVQPINTRLLAVEGGNYTESDRRLFTVYKHNSDELILHAGIKYRVVELTERNYSDVNQYVLRRVVAHAAG
ncbi:hypothetical protein [Paenibacillus odorifer]|uniref:hypothetical protein n=1 Tax=Paenibacillus odorifer TaxID=189426 RepID=UPI00096E617F|nr:hypothetical protein [Paenibacillus odorifer]OME53788.1 hypothetical protein BSK61_16290 [Paenibacillus odorifer]